MRQHMFLSWLVGLSLLGVGCPSTDDDDSADDDDDTTADDDDSTADDDDSGDDDDDDSGGDDDDSAVSPPSVLLFAADDDDSGLALETRLGEDGIPVTRHASYWDWDGASPSPADFDVVLIFEGDDYGDGFTSAGDAALVNWLTNGGTLIRTEWASYSIGDPSVDAQYAIDETIPVAYQGSYEYDTTWTVTDTTHPLTAGLPATWVATDDGCSVVTAASSALVVATSDLCGPAITLGEANALGGRVIHVNGDLGADSSATPGTEMLQVMTNAVWFGAP